MCKGISERTVVKPWSSWVAAEKKKHYRFLLLSTINMKPGLQWQYYQQLNDWQTGKMCLMQQMTNILAVAGVMACREWFHGTSWNPSVLLLSIVCVWLLTQQSDTLLTRCIVPHSQICPFFTESMLLRSMSQGKRGRQKKITFWNWH